MEKKKTKNGAASSSKHPRWLDSFTNLPTQTKSTSSSEVSDTLFLEIKNYQRWCQFVKLLHNEHLVLIRKQVIQKKRKAIISVDKLYWRTILHRWSLLGSALKKHNVVKRKKKKCVDDHILPVVAKWSFLKHWKACIEKGFITQSFYTVLFGAICWTKIWRAAWIYSLQSTTLLQLPTQESWVDNFCIISRDSSVWYRDAVYVMSVSPWNNFDEWTFLV